MLIFPKGMQIQHALCIKHFNLTSQTPFFCVETGLNGATEWCERE